MYYTCCGKVESVVGVCYYTLRIRHLWSDACTRYVIGYVYLHCIQRVLVVADIAATLQPPLFLVISYTKPTIQLQLKLYLQMQLQLHLRHYGSYKPSRSKSKSTVRITGPLDASTNSRRARISVDVMVLVLMPSGTALVDW